MNELTKEVFLQAHDKNGSVQFTVTIPNQFVSLYGWEKGDKLNLTAVLGSGKLVIEK